MDLYLIPANWQVAPREQTANSHTWLFYMYFLVQEDMQEFQMKNALAELSINYPSIPVHL